MYDRGAPCRVVPIRVTSICGVIVSCQSAPHVNSCQFVPCQFVSCRPFKTTRVNPRRLLSHPSSCQFVHPSIAPLILVITYTHNNNNDNNSNNNTSRNNSNHNDNNHDHNNAHNDNNNNNNDNSNHDNDNDTDDNTQ